MQKEKLTDTQRELVEANLGLARMAAWKYRESCARVGIDFDDAFSIACLGLMNGVRHYDPSSSKPGTYLMRGCELAILMELRRHRASTRCTAMIISVETPIRTDNDGNMLTIADTLVSTGPEMEDECIATILVDNALRKITPRQAEILP